ncbi:hypothetical protein [Syntrophus aciditrophicus]|uniref:Hypothetical cytosolic protein n=1 Tax=Syntrophus aciditrophicus (strain SB) TaxID=56780 RepID=Q2LPK7_SYNAS|nr:hypothetical protein [Syntrophus aciditrophicus]ABC75901.1 hypothetical cytosolic protein [Syntrophus aciditrophicus SB]
MAEKRHDSIAAPWPSLVKGPGGFARAAEVRQLIDPKNGKDGFNLSDYRQKCSPYFFSEKL